VGPERAVVVVVVVALVLWLWLWLLLNADGGGGGVGDVGECGGCCWEGCGSKSWLTTRVGLLEVEMVGREPGPVSSVTWGKGV
jgi:hypothetical protein